jgi:ABC-type dipeptide/oligopeptide/nickel transport system ATPase subunit
MQAIVQIRDLEKIYGNKSNITKALNGVSFEVFQGEYVGVMGGVGQRQNHSAQLYFYYRSRNVRADFD